MRENSEKTSSKVTKPPGGDCSDIFATAPLATPPSTPRKKNHMSSNIFGPADAAPASAPRKAVGDSTSFNKLFGEMKVANGNEGTKATVASPGSTPRPTKDHQKSNIFFTEKTNGTTNGTNGTNGSVTPELNGHSKDKIVGDVHDSASSSGNSSGCVTPNGSSTPPNGSVNGDAEPRTNGHNGTTNGVGVGGTAAAGDVMGTPKKRIPPGGHSTKLW